MATFDIFRRGQNAAGSDSVQHDASLLIEVECIENIPGLMVLV